MGIIGLPNNHFQFLKVKMKSESVMRKRVTCKVGNNKQARRCRTDEEGLFGAEGV